MRRLARRSGLAMAQRWMFAGRLGETPMRVTPSEAARIRRRLGRTPATLERPVRVLSGYLDPGLYARVVADQLGRLTRDGAQDVRAIVYRLAGPIEEMAEEVRSKLPSGPVDLVGLSMGGLVARQVARAEPDRVHRIFTLGTPHRGAALADRLAPTAAAQQMRRGSPFLADLDASASVPHELHCYAMDGDTVIGPDAGWATSGTAYRLARRRGEPHLHIMADPIVLLDVALRLRGEPGLLVPMAEDDAAAPQYDDDRT